MGLRIKELGDDVVVGFYSTVMKELSVNKELQCVFEMSTLL